MSDYTKPIIRYGLITPVLFYVGVTLALLTLDNRFQQLRKQKEARYKKQLERLASIRSIADEIAPKRKTFEEQRLLLQLDPSHLFTQLSDAILSKYQSIELERTGMFFPSDRGRVGRYAECEVARIRSNFEGGFGPMQETLLQVESLMPQTVLEDLKITRKANTLPNKPRHLVFEMTHLCWKAAGEKP